MKNFPASACSPNRKYEQRENNVTCTNVIGISLKIKYNFSHLGEEKEKTAKWIPEATVAKWYAAGWYIA
jgi:hypothetical protein